MKVRLHFNRRAKIDDYVWTVHTSKQCIPAKCVSFVGTGQTEWLPNKKTNPRASIVFDVKDVQILRNGIVRLITN